MTEMESFISDKSSGSQGTSKTKEKEKSNMLIISDSDYKSTKTANLNFSTKYLTFKEEIKLMMHKNSTIYSRNVKTLLFVFLTPFIFLFILQMVQSLSNFYNTSIVVKDHEEVLIDNVDLKCAHNPYGKYKNDCISVGIAVIVKLY